MANEISNRRPLLWLTMLACATLLSACLDKSCGLTGPSETAGSQEKEGTNLFVVIRYQRFDDVRGWVPKSPVTVEVGRAGLFRLNLDTSSTVVIERVQKNESFDLIVDGVPKITCTWNGTTEVFQSDANIAVTPSTTIPNLYITSCGRGWTK